MPLSPAPLAAVDSFFGAEIAGYSVLQLTVGAFAIIAVIGGMRWAFGKAFNNKS